MLRELVHGLTDRRPGHAGAASRDAARRGLVAVLAHADRHPVADALGRAFWGVAVTVCAIAGLLAGWLALSTLLAALPAHPALLAAGVAAGFGLAWSLPFLVVRAVRWLLASRERTL